MKFKNLLLVLMAMLVSGVVSAQTAVTPAAGTANPFAYALSSEVADSILPSIIRLTPMPKVLK